MCRDAASFPEAIFLLLEFNKMFSILILNFLGSSDDLGNVCSGHLYIKVI